MKIAFATSRNQLARASTAFGDSARPAAKPEAARAERFGYSGVSSFEARPEPRPQVMSQELDRLMPRPGRYAISGPETVRSANIRGARMPADRYQVEIRGHRIPVTVGKGELEPGMHQAEIGEVAQALARLPDEALREVREVQISPRRSPDDAFWAREYEDPDFRSGMTTGAAGVTTIYPHPYALDDASTAATLLHETTHAWTNREWGNGGNGRQWRQWAAAAAADGRVVSDYATESVKEDVSETAALYLATRGTPRFERERARYPNRFAILDDRFGAP